MSDCPSFADVHTPGREPEGQRTTDEQRPGRTKMPFTLARVSQLRVFGARYAAEFSGKARQLGLQTILEGSVLGLFFALWWRTSHVAEKAKYDKYYAQLRAEQAAAAE